MNEYIFYTVEGSTKGPNGNEIENCQVLGRLQAKNERLAKQLLLQDNPWIIESGFNPANIIAKQIFTEDQKKDIETVVEYLWEDEQRHCQELSYPKWHIYKVLRRLKNCYK